MQPDTGLLADQVKSCLQESDEVPPDITTLFDSSLFKLDTSIVPKAIRLDSFVFTTQQLYLAMD